MTPGASAALRSIPASPLAGVGAGRRFVLPAVLAALNEAGAAPERVCQELGLEGAALWALVRNFAPDYETRLPPAIFMAGSGEEAPEEEDLRDFLMDYVLEDAGAESLNIGRCLARIIARRCQKPNHLWQDMGYGDRTELNAMFSTYFPGLRAANSQDMKWKKFLYRQLCEREGVRACRAPVCDVCDDFADCFGGEEGAPLLARGLRGLWADS